MAVHASDAGNQDGPIGPANSFLVQASYTDAKAAFSAHFAGPPAFRNRLRADSRTPNCTKAEVARNPSQRPKNQKLEMFEENWTEQGRKKPISGK